MKIMKLLAACAMVGALATTTAMAAPVQKTFLGEYDATNNSIAINLANEEVAAYAATAAGDLTVLVTSVDVEGQITNSNIFQIDQGTLASLENDTDADTNVKLAVLKLSAAVKTDYDAVMDDDDETVPVNSTYYVRLGGAEGSYIYDTFTFEAPEVEDPEDPKPETEAKMIGDFNVDEDVTTADMKLIAKCIAGTYEDYEEIDYYAASYANEDMDMTTADMKEIAAAIAGSGGERIWYYADLYYDTEEEVYLIYGDLYEGE